jgi:flagellar hook protein FlgE
MLRGMGNAVTAMGASQQAFTTISNNLANAQTTAYKSQETEFEEVFYQQMKTPSAPGPKLAGTNPSDIGNGVRVAGNVTNFSQGSVTNTQNKTDLAIQGDGFFVLGDRQGQDRVYTRNGSFDISKDNELVTKSGSYVLGWNMDPLTGAINTGATIEAVKLPLGEVAKPVESTEVSLRGNLDISSEIGEQYGLQIPSWDRLGVRHDIDVTFIKTSGNTFRYLAVPSDQFKPSASIETAVLRPSGGIASSLIKGDYQLATAASATPGMVDITVTDPSGAIVLTQTITDASTTVTLSDGTNPWFTIKYVSGNAPSTSTFTIGEAGNISFNSIGQISSITGSSASGAPLITYTPVETGQPVNVDVRMESFTGLAADSGIKLVSTDGMPAATLTNFSISDGGVIDGYYSDGSIKPIAQVAMATFSNPLGLTRKGQGSFAPTPSSGPVEIGISNTGSRGLIKAQALEGSNTDIASEFVNMVSIEKLFQSSAKIIKTAEEILTTVINLIR